MTKRKKPLLPPDKHLIKDCCLRVLLSTNLMNCLPRQLSLVLSLERDKHLQPAARQPDELPAKTTVNSAQLGEGQAPDQGLPPARPAARQPDELPARTAVNSVAR